MKSFMKHRDPTRSSVVGRSFGITVATLVLTLSLSGCMAVSLNNTSVTATPSPTASATVTQTPEVVADLGWRTPGISEFMMSSAAVKGTKVYTAGFSAYHGSPNAEGAVIIDPATGLIASGVTGWPHFFRTLPTNPLSSDLEYSTGQIFAAIADPNEAGAFFVGGDFTHVDGIPHARLARIKPDGTLDAAWTGTADGTVRALATNGTSLFVGGLFDNVTDSIGTHPSAKVAKFNATSGLIQTAFTSNVILGSSVGVYAVGIFPGGRVAIGGEFEDCTATCWNYAVLNENTGVATADGGMGADAPVFAITGTATMMFVAGAFSNIMGNAAVGLAALDATNPAVFFGALDANGAVRALALDATHCYVAGSFTDIAGTPVTSVARVLLANGLVDAAWAPVLSSAMWGPNAPVAAIYPGATRVFLGGSFTMVNGENRVSVAAVDKVTGTSTDPVNLNVSSQALFGGMGYYGELIGIGALIESGGHLLIGGSLTSFGGVARPTMAEIDLVTGLPTSWSPVLDIPYVRKAAIAGDLLYITGFFTTIDGQPRAGLASFDLSSGSPVLTAWNPAAADGMILDIEVNATSVFVYGQFSTIGGQPRAELAAFDHGSNVPNAWEPTVNNPIGDDFFSGMRAYSDAVYFTGQFTLVNGVDTRNGAAAVDAVTGATLPWNPDLDANPTTIARVGSEVWVGGHFSTINGGTPREKIAATHATTGADLGWAPTPDEGVNSITVVGSHVYVGGSFITIAGEVRNGMAKFNVADRSITSWSHTLPAYLGMNAFTVPGDPDDTVYAFGMGWGNSINGAQPSVNFGLSRFRASTGEWLAPQ